MGANLTGFLRPLIRHDVAMGDIYDAARRAGFDNAGSLKAIASMIRRKGLGRAPLPAGKCFHVAQRVEDYIRDVAREYGISSAEAKRRLLTIICDDDLAHAVLGDPPPRRAGRQAMTGGAS